MCQLPNHASNVPLVLNMQTGSASPQIYSIYENEFSNCKCDAKFKSLWQFKAKLQEKPTSPNRVDILPTKTPPIITLPMQETNVNPLPASTNLLSRFIEQWNGETYYDAPANKDEEPRVKTIVDDTSKLEPPNSATK
jgi:hypothetical protein